MEFAHIYVHIYAECNFSDNAVNDQQQIIYCCEDKQIHCYYKHISINNCENFQHGKFDEHIQPITLPF